jgi:deoxyribodipyrimidine photolyase-related protein
MRSNDPLKKHARMRSARTLLVILGDQLDRDMPILSELDNERDAVLMMEVRDEAEHVPSHKKRTALFLSAMRHFAVELVDKGHRVRYVKLDDDANTQSFAGELRRAAKTLSPERIVVTEPGEHRVRRVIDEFADEFTSGGGDRSFDVLPDEHFFVPLDEFADWAEGRKSMIMEFFYREQRKKTGYLMEAPKKPAGGTWNFDKENREAFKRTPRIRKPYKPRTDDITDEVLALVARTWPDAPGTTENFAWPVTREQALRALDDFIEHRLPKFGTYEDAMWTSEPFLYHSLLSSALNLKLLNPRECVEKAIDAYEAGDVSLNNVEGFVRQLIGWREYIRGIYYYEGPKYADRNGLNQKGPLPEFFWSGETDMRCLSECIGSVVEHAYSHHIPRLMVIGNFAMLAGVDPKHVNEWFLAMYVDAVEWATAPNVIGMSQHADKRPGSPTGETGIVGTKPYAASGKYISRMSNFCEHCPYDPGSRDRDASCPFNVLYWDFLIRHRETFRDNNRMAMILKNVDRMNNETKADLTVRGERIREQLASGRARKLGSDHE